MFLKVTPLLELFWAQGETCWLLILFNRYYIKLTNQGYRNGLTVTKMMHHWVRAFLLVD